MNKIPVFICGGHFSPALAITERLIKNENLSLFYIGRKYSQTGVESLEYKELSKLNLKLLLLETGKFNRFFSFSTFTALFKVILGILRSIDYINRYKPRIIISFGSYVALPVCIAGKIFNIPIVTHEQTRVMGLSNRIISVLSATVCTTFHDTRKIPFFIKPHVTGVPLRNAIINPKDSGITGFGNKNLPLIYITGGSQGSASINAVIYEIVPDLLNKFRIIHVCGATRNLYDYHRLFRKRSGLEKKIRSNYYLTPYLDQGKVGEVIKKSTLVVSRAGANSIFELSFYNKRAILIPLPWAAYNEQYENAKYLEGQGLAVVINQNRLKADILLNSIFESIGKNDIVTLPQHEKLEFQGTERLVKIIERRLFS